jgi:hypothetical protein
MTCTRLPLPFIHTRTPKDSQAIILVDSVPFPTHFPEAHQVTPLIPPSRSLQTYRPVSFLTLVSRHHCIPCISRNLSVRALSRVIRYEGFITIRGLCGLFLVRPRGWKFHQQPHSLNHHDRNCRTDICAADSNGYYMSLQQWNESDCHGWQQRRRGSCPTDFPRKIKCAYS